MDKSSAVLDGTSGVGRASRNVTDPSALRPWPQEILPPRDALEGLLRQTACLVIDLEKTAKPIIVLHGRHDQACPPLLHHGHCPRPTPQHSHHPKNNNNNNQQNQCGNGQSLYCCTSAGNKADVECVSFTNGGLGGVCNGIQMCCNNNNGNQGCNFNVGGGTITIKKTVKNFGW
ncbi:vacuolar VAC7 [Fusarium coicis]|nr:vacuolar VAC7 [Fusarium coicis]